MADLGLLIFSSLVHLSFEIPLNMDHNMSSVASYGPRAVFSLSPSVSAKFDRRTKTVGISLL